MPDYVFPLRPQPALAVVGMDSLYPVARIFCVGRNYVAHAAEMGSEVDREAPFYFTKSAHALLQPGTVMPYPPGTNDLHHEIELVVALGGPAFQIAREAALSVVMGYAVGLDMTRRDLQARAKDQRRPWDTGKDFEASAIISAITPTNDVPDIEACQISLTVNGATRQQSSLRDMVWDVAGIIGHLSTLYHLDAGDLIMTGTPAGVAAVAAGDVLEGAIPGLAPLRVTIG